MRSNAAYPLLAVKGGREWISNRYEEDMKHVTTISHSEVIEWTGDEC
jgi:hypothetical protein